MGVIRRLRTFKSDKGAGDIGFLRRIKVEALFLLVLFIWAVSGSV